MTSQIKWEQHVTTVTAFGYVDGVHKYSIGKFNSGDIILVDVKNHSY